MADLPTPSELLRADLDAETPIPTHEGLWGFGGLHGGLALALAGNAMQRAVGDKPMRSITGHFLRPTRRDPSIEVTELRRGKATDTMAAAMTANDRPTLSATATFGTAGGASTAGAPTAPTAGTPDDHESFMPPPEFVPITTSMDIRPVGGDLPYSGGPRPRLTAWIRLTDDDAPIDTAALIVLADALAPAYAATLTDLAMIPTVELTVRPTGVERATSPWCLLEARSETTTADGWIHESIEVWDPDGVHLGAAHQLRMLTGSVFED